MLSSLTSTRLCWGTLFSVCAFLRSLFLSLLRWKVLTRFLQSPMACAVRSWSLSSPWETAKWRLWPKQLSHGQPWLRIAATMLAPLSVVIEAILHSCNSQSAKSDWRASASTSAVWFWGMYLVSKHFDCSPVSSYVVCGHAHVWDHIWSWPHLCNGRVKGDVISPSECHLLLCCTWMEWQFGRFVCHKFAAYF